MLDRVADGNVAVQRDGAQVHDGGCGEQHVQVDPDWTQTERKGPGVICKRETLQDNRPEEERKR